MAATLWHLTLFYGILVAVGFAATGHVVASAVLSQWFVVRRGLVVGLLSGASMSGMTILTPLAMWLILLMGWRGTYWVLAAAALVLIVPLGVWVVRDRPERMGLAPDGLPSNPVEIAASAAAVERAERTTASEAARTLAFWQLMGGFFGCGFSMNLISAHGVPMLTDHGFHPMTAASALGLLGAVSIGGATLLGFLSDRYGRRLILGIIYAVRAVVFAGLVLAGTTGSLLTVVVVGGIGWSGSMAMTSALTADLFGRYSVGSIFGMVFFSHQVGAALGSWLGGVLYDATGGYGAPFGLASAILLVSAALSLTIRREPRAVAVQSRPAEISV
jgi:MFS family permease